MSTQPSMSRIGSMLPFLFACCSFSARASCSFFPWRVSVEPDWIWCLLSPSWGPGFFRSSPGFSSRSVWPSLQVSILFSLRHPRIVSLFDVVEGRDQLHLATRLADEPSCGYATIGQEASGGSMACQQPCRTGSGL